ncbi:MAG: hypothetical protein MK033_04460 [Candidatus Caenarcaniphilales bacterium]|nr:hypothetical protein [Candidatus Caenarcaniphilales bacterium]
MNLKAGGSGDDIRRKFDELLKIQTEYGKDSKVKRVEADSDINNGSKFVTENKARESRPKAEKLANFGVNKKNKMIMKFMV